MNKDKQPLKLTKAELIKTVILAFILALVFIYSLYKSLGALRHNLIILSISTAIGLVILFLSVYVGVKKGLKNRERN